MKKFILLAASAALVLGACSKNVVTSVDDEAIGFGTYAPTSVTKADGSYASSTALPSGQKFVVYGYNQGSSDFASSLVPSFMNGVEVTTNSTNEDLTSYTPLRYWPKDEANNKLAFYAYYPLNTTNITPTVTSGLGSYAFTVNSDITKQSDFMISDLKTDCDYTNCGGTAGVALTFHHQLTQVFFNVKSKDNYYSASDPKLKTKITVRSLKLQNVKTKGKLTPTATTATTAPFATTTSTAWSDLNKVANFVIPFSTDYLTTTAAPVKAAANVFLMIPQNLYTGASASDDNTDDVKVEIQYTVETDGDAAVNITKVIDLKDFAYGSPATTLTTWEKNKSIVYTITIALNKIEFSATVGDWSVVTPGFEI